jgi:TolA-binding protein
MLKRYVRVYMFVLGLLALTSMAQAQFGLGGPTVVFDPQMFARQLLQLQQETAVVTSLAQQLQYMIQNTTGGSAGIWQSNQNLLANLGPELSGRADRAANPRAEEPDCSRQSAGGADRQRDRPGRGPTNSAATPTRDGGDEFAEHRRRQSAQQPDPKPARGTGASLGTISFGASRSTAR